MNKLQESGLQHSEANNNKISFLRTQFACKNCQLEDFCAQLGANAAIPNQLNQIAEHPRPLRRGEHLFRQGDQFRNLYIVCTGGIKLYLTTYDGTEQILNFYFPGELLSLDSIESHQYNTSALALDITSVCKLPFDRIMNLCHQDPNIYDQLFKFAGLEIAKKHNMMLTLGQKPAEEKFAAFLLDISMRNKNSGHYHSNLQLSMSRHDIANYLCLADETISRLFSRFSTDGILVTSRKSVQILDFESLEILANVGRKELLQNSS
jgi:CRP/FNR family transcriptional regulator, anaerobic regulatory protein